MQPTLDLQTYNVNQKMEKVLKPLRMSLAEMELDIVGELDVADILSRKSPLGSSRSKILLVDCPFLDFEAMALDRASAVFFPLHILVTANGNWTRISMINPAGLFDARLPAGAANPMDRLLARVALAVDAVARQSERANPPKKEV